MFEIFNEIAQSFEGYSIIWLTVGFITFWFALSFIWLKVPIPARSIQQQQDMQNRVVSIVHGVVILLCAAYEVFITKRDQELQAPNNWFEHFWGAWSMSYFFVDTIMMLKLNLANKAILLHHGVLIVGYIVMIHQGHGGAIEFVGIYTAEISNFPMHLRIILKDYGRRNTKLYDVLEYTYISLYIYGRFILSSIITFKMWMYAPNCSILIKLAGTTVVCQSYYFIYQMVSVLKNKFRQHVIRK